MYHSVMGRITVADEVMVDVPIGTQRTCRVALHMSAFGVRADMTFCTANVVTEPK
jgi:hypothetical protein